MRSLLQATAIGILALVAAPAFAADAGWLVRVCPKETIAKHVTVSVTDAKGQNKTDVAAFDFQQPTKNEFPVTGPLANADSLRVESHATPGDALAYVCVFYGQKLVRAITFNDLIDATVSKTESDKNCPCKP